MDKLSEEKTYSRRKYMEQRSRENVKVASGPVNYTILKDVLEYVTVQPNFIALQMRLIVNTYLRRLSPNSHPPMEICNQQGTGTGGRGPFYKLDRITRRICRRYKYNIKFPTKKKFAWEIMLLRWWAIHQIMLMKTLQIQIHRMKQWHQNTCYDIEHCTFSRPLWDHNMYRDPKWWISI